MSERRPLVAGNWKMNGSRAGVDALVAAIKSGLGGIETTEVAVCPPFVFLQQVSGLLAGTRVALGAQNVCDKPEGAYTGEVSGAMLREYNCRFAIVGHSERRNLYAESDALVAERFVQAQACGLTPILCVGEKLDEREAGRTEQTVKRQLNAVVERVGAQAFAQAVLAYEPVWAIGTGRTATPEQAQDVHAFLRAELAARNAGVASGLRILYGGSVNAANAQGLFQMADIDGGLIGGASLRADEFLAICRTAEGPME